MPADGAPAEQAVFAREATFGPAAESYHTGVPFASRRCSPAGTHVERRSGLATGQIPIVEQQIPPRSVVVTQVTEWEGGRSRPLQDSLAAEEPLEIRISGHPLMVTMRTPGHDRELAAGLLLAEGIIESSGDVLCIRQPPTRPGAKSNVVDVELASGRDKPDVVQPRTFATSSACGVCGKASINSIRNKGFRLLQEKVYVNPEMLCELPGRLRKNQQVFGRTGGLHAAALFDENGSLIAVREDIGRHNAVDKIVGGAFLSESIPLSRHVLMVSGRGGFEIVQKALAAGIPIVASVSAPSSLAVQLAREFGLTLIGFLRGHRFVVYSSPWRCLSKTP
jgi:FdhD protein